jgi:hypothetical protein
MRRGRCVSSSDLENILSHYISSCDYWYQARKSDIEVAKVARENQIRELAEKQVDESLDMVKMLNTLGARAAAFTIRDKQLAERDARAATEGVSEGSLHVLPCSG